MKHPLLILLFGLILGLGCAGHQVANPKNPPDGVTVTVLIPTAIDSHFAPDEMLAIRSAVDEWNKSLNGYARFDELADVGLTDGIPGVGDEKPAVLMIHPAPPVLARPMGLWGAAGWYDPGEAAIYLDVSSLSGITLRTVTEHELGHFLGAGHMKIPGSLMFPSVGGQNDCIDRLTLQQVASAHYLMGWRWQHMLPSCRVEQDPTN